MKINSNSIRKMITIHLLFVVIFLFLWSVTGLPWAFIYIFDLLLCVEFLWILPNLQRTMQRIGATHFVPWMIIFALFLILTQMVNLVSPLPAILAFRRTFRFYLFFLVCAVLLTKKNIEQIMKMLLKVQVLNVILTMIQFFSMGLSQDNLGGIFGIEKGANAYSNVFLCIICAFVIVKYLEKQIKLWPMLFVVASALLIAALAELKIFFIEIVVIVVMGILLSNPSARTVKTISIIAVGFVAAMALFGSLFPAHLAILLSWALLSQYTTESIYGYEISRLNAFPEINDIFFKDNLLRNLFGNGFGSGEEGTVFFSKYSHYNYSWFTHQVTFLETGYVGILFTFSFFVLIYIFAAKSKKINPENRLYYSFAQIISALCVIWMMYDASLRGEVAFLIFFALAIPLVIRNDWQQNCSVRKTYDPTGRVFDNDCGK